MLCHRCVHLQQRLQCRRAAFHRIQDVNGTKTQKGIQVFAGTSDFIELGENLFEVFTYILK